jgi:hypothetical protein
MGGTKECLAQLRPDMDAASQRAIAAACRKAAARKQQ